MDCYHWLLSLLQVRQRNNRLVQRSDRRREAALQVTCLRAWQAVARYRHQRRVAIMRLLTKHLLNRKYHAFHRWGFWEACGSGTKSWWLQYFTELHKLLNPHD